MLAWLWTIPALPLAGFLCLVFLKLSKVAVRAIGVGSVGLAAAVTLGVALTFVASPPPDSCYRQVLGTWIPLEGYQAVFGLYLDPTALLMALVVTCVGFLIHLYSAEHMAGESGYRRFFACMNLFAASMLVLVLADNLLLLYLGWEGVGLCSYLLIGFWYENPANGRAARKAFVVTRAGDAAFALGLFLLYRELGTLDIQQAMERAASQWTAGSAPAVTASALILAGAVGKSAQIPLQTWLPDAMAGPSPVSALIHAATMVTAGVYLVARTHVLFELAPLVHLAVAIVGAATLILAAASALAQRDIKRVLAYSTISQIGYMFLALGVGAYTAALFHFMTHAFFKALLFLAAGVVIQALHEEHDVYAMGGLRRRMPLVFWTFLAGAASLAALPAVTAGFFSKDAILWAVWSSDRGGPGLWAVGLSGAFLTSLYTFRMVFLVFFGPTSKREITPPGLCVGVPLVVLAILSLAGGWIELPAGAGGLRLLSDFLGSGAGPQVVEPGGDSHGLEFVLGAASAAVCLAGVAAAWWLWLARPRTVEALNRTFFGDRLRRFWLAGWGFDALYDLVFVQPYRWIAERNRADFVDDFYRGVARANVSLHGALSRTQTGRVRWYALGMAAGAVLLLAVVVFL